jgi:hypothetical protein
MAEKEKTREEVVAEWVQSEGQRLRQERKSRRDLKGIKGLSINSLMDCMTIILIFLLMNYSLDPIRVDTSEDLKLPPSTSEIVPKATASVTVTAKEIVVADETILTVKDGTVDKHDKQGGDENSLQIQPLFDALTKEVTAQKEMARLRGAKFDGVLTVIAHGETPYRLLTEVLYTAGQAEFAKFKFAIVKGGRRGT